MPVIPALMLKVRWERKKQEMDLLDNLDAMFRNIHRNTRRPRFASICLGIGVWMSTTSVASKTFDFEVDNRKHAPVISPTMPDDLTTHLASLFRCKTLVFVRPWIASSLSTQPHTVPRSCISSGRRAGFSSDRAHLERRGGSLSDFKYLAVIESGLSQVVSPSGASGFWQFMKRTAPEYGLEVSATVDERYHVEKATRAACAYLKDAHAKFGSWVLAAASYNMGRSGVANVASQHVSTYWDLHLNSETARYVYRLLALREVMERPEGTMGFIWASRTTCAFEKAN